MIRGLKVAMVFWAVVWILMGLAFIFIPDQFLAMMGVEGATGFELFSMAQTGVSLIAISVFLILAARDPLRHINWVKLAILWCLLAVVIDLYASIRGNVDFSQIGVGMTLDAIAALSFLALYPYRAAKVS